MEKVKKILASKCNVTGLC